MVKSTYHQCWTVSIANGSSVLKSCNVEQRLLRPDPSRGLGTRHHLMDMVIWCFDGPDDGPDNGVFPLIVTRNHYFADDLPHARCIYTVLGSPSTTRLHFTVETIADRPDTVLIKNHLNGEKIMVSMSEIEHVSGRLLALLKEHVENWIGYSVTFTGIRNDHSKTEYL